MLHEIKFGVNFLKPDKNKKLKRKDGIDCFYAVALAKGDSIDNYEEVDELWSPDLPEASDDVDIFEDIVVEPDVDGRISYEDAKKLIDVIHTMQKRFIDMQEFVDMVHDKFNV